ncbi:MAG: hypothetical protein R2713_16885 [Ilumatobacteraceae bacterium]
MRHDGPRSARGPRRGRSATLARASDFFGPEVLGSMLGERVMPRVLAGRKVSLLGALDRPHDMSYLPDVARTLVTLATDERAGEPRGSRQPRHAHPATPSRHSLVPPGRRCVSSPPWAIVNAAGVFVPMMRELRRDPVPVRPPVRRRCHRHSRHPGSDRHPVARGRRRHRRLVARSHAAGVTGDHP